VTFLDYEPEDAWDAEDDPQVQALNLLRRLDLLDRQGEDDGERTLRDMLDDIERRLAPYRRTREQYEARDRLRIDQLIEDLDFIRERV